MVSSMVLHHNVPFPFAVEVHASLQAIKSGTSMGYQTTEIEGDSRTMIKKYISKDLEKSEIETIIRDIQKRKAYFNKIYFHFVPRSANMLAHTLACETLKSRKETNLVGGVPNYVHRDFD